MNLHLIPNFLLHNLIFNSVTSVWGSVERKSTLTIIRIAQAQKKGSVKLFATNFKYK